MKHILFAIAALLMVLWLSLLPIAAPTSVYAESSVPNKPHVSGWIRTSIPCHSVGGILTASHQATQEVSQYRVTFTAQGVGRMISYSLPIYYWIQTAINSPSSAQPYTDTLTVDDPYYQLRLTGLGMYVQSADCNIYSGTTTITNAAITPLQLAVR